MRCRRQARRHQECARPIRRQYGMRAISLLPTNLYGPGDNFSLKGLARAVWCSSAVWATRSAQPWGRRVDGLGHSALRAGSSCTWTTLPMSCVFRMEHYESERARSTSGQGADLHDPRNSPTKVADGRRFHRTAGYLLKTCRSPTAPPGSCWIPVKSMR